MSDSVDLGSIFASVGLNLAPLEAGVAGVKASVGAVTAELRKVDAAAPGSKLKAGMTPAIAALDQTAASAAKTGKEVTKLGGLNPGAKLGTSIMSVLPALGTLAAGIAALGIGAAKMSADFDTSLNQVRNNTTMSAKDFDVMRKAVIQMGNESGASFDDLAKGFMHVENFGYQGADAVKILDAAMKSAVATGGSVADTADILAKAMTEFSFKAADAGRVMNVLHLAAADGNMTLEQFDSVAGRAFSAAANLGAGFTATSAAITALTQHGFDAAEAVTQVADVFQHLLQQSKSTKEELARLSAQTGIPLTEDFTAAGIKAKDLYGIFVDLALATQNHAEEVFKLVPALRGGQGAMALAGTAAQSYTTDLQRQNAALKGDLDPSTAGYTRTLQTFNQQVAIVSNEIKSEFLPVGEKMIPVFRDAIPFIKGVADVLKDVLTVFSELPRPLQDSVIAFGAVKTALDAVGISIGVSKAAGLLGRFGALGVAEGEAAEAGVVAFSLGNPFMFALAGVAAALTGIVGLYGQWQDKQDALAAKAAALKASTDTPDTRTNIAAQVGINQAKSKAIQGEIDNPSTAPGYINPTTARTGMTQQAREASNAALVVKLRSDKAAIDASTAALQGDLAGTGDLANARRNLIRSTSEAAALITANTAEEGRIRIRLASVGTGANAYSGRGAPYNQTADHARLTELLRVTALLAQDRIKNLAVLSHLSSSAAVDNVAGSLGTDAGNDVGEKIAHAAWSKQLTIDRADYNRGCARLARETISSVTPLFDNIWDRSPHATAITDLARFRAAGLAMPFKAGTAVPPGSMLFSQTMGEGSGHVQTVGDNGNRFDQHGENYYALKNFQWYVPPPGTPGARKGAGGALSDDQMSAVQADRDDTYSVTHDDYQNRRHDAYQRYDEDVSKAAGDPVALKAAKERLHAFLADIAKDKKKQDDEDAALQAKQTARLEKTQDTQISIAARHATSLAGTMASIYGTQGDLDAAGSDPVRFAKERAAAQEAFQHSVRAISNDSTGIGRFPSQEQIKDTIAAYRLMQTRLAEVATEQGTYDADQADKEQAKADRVQAKEDKRQKNLYLTDKQANGAGYLSYLNNQDQSAKSSGDDDRDASLQQDIAGVQAPSSAIAAATAEAQKALWKTAGGSMNEYFQDERTQLAAQADDFAKSGVAQDEIDTYVALKGKVIDAEQAAATTTKAFDALKEEFEDGKLSAIRYEEALRALAATSSDPAQEKLLDDAIRGAGKDAEKANPYNALADSFKGDIGTNIVGKFFDEMIEKGKLAKNFFKSFVEDMKKMIAELAEKFAMAQIFGSRFGGGMNFSGAGNGAQVTSYASGLVNTYYGGGQGGGSKGSGIANLLGGLFGQSKSNGLGPTIPQTSPQWPVVDQAPNVAGGGVAQGSLIANLFGPQAGAPTSGPSTPSAGAPGGGAGGASALAGMAPLLTKGVGSLFGSGAGAGFAAAMPWIGGGLLAAQLLFGKKFHLFSEGGVVPGVGVHDRVPAMLTPGEGVLTRDQMRAGSGGGGRGMPPITINHYGDVNGVEGLNTMADTIGYHVYQRLPVATS
jgi:TP901 family phage tail tape measure protein